MSDVAARLRDRASQEGLAVSDELGARLLAFFRLLERWNRKINLTSLLDPVEAVDRLLLEPLAAAKHLPQGCVLADLGSGGGSPAIPLALALAAPELLMVESRSRKAAFLREAATEVQLHATVEAARFEDVSQRPAYAGRFDVVSIRAVRPDAAALSSAAALLRPGGIIALFQAADADVLPPSIAPDLTWRGTRPLLRSTGSQLALCSTWNTPQ
jgi:16S rRNA (guanine527-N7)-methyltransferase